jgi:hypothetical protein
MFSATRILGSVSQSSSVHLGSLLLLVLIVASPLSASKRPFTVPNDLALRIRLDDTLTTKDSQVGDPFSATVVDEGTYQNARVYGRITRIDLSGKIEGHTTMMLEFNRLVMPDGRQAPIRAEIVAERRKGVILVYPRLAAPALPPNLRTRLPQVLIARPAWCESTLIIRSGSCWWEAWKSEWDRPRRVRPYIAKSRRRRKTPSRKCGKPLH